MTKDKATNIVNYFKASVVLKEMGISVSEAKKLLNTNDIDQYKASYVLLVLTAHKLFSKYGEYGFCFHQISPNKMKLGYEF